MAEVDSLTISIESESEKASAGINGLVSVLNSLKTSTSKATSGLSSIAKQLTAIASAVNSISGNGAEKIRALSESLQTLRGLDGIKISSSIGTQISKIAAAVSNVQWTDGDKLTALADGLRPLSSLGRSNLTTFITQLGKLPAVMKELDQADMGKFAAQMREAAAAIAPLANEMNKVAAGFSSFPSKIQRLVQGNASLVASNQKAAKSFGFLGTGISSTAAKFGIYGVAFRRLASLMGDWVTESNDYVENLNLFRVAMGDAAEGALEYAETVNKAVGIDPSAWIRNQGLFKQITSGFGVAQEQANLMSQNLTQLGYDISSFYNISIEDAMTKLQSAIAGEIEPVRRLGYAIDVATLQQVAYSHGINQSVNTMNQAQKSQLRYIALMEQSGNVLNDFARTSQTPANALRILQSQITQLGRALGNLLIPFLQQVIPWVQAFVEILTAAIQRLALLVGFELPTIDYSGMGGLTSGAEEAEEALSGAAGAAKKLKDYTLGIDELNIISPDTGGGGGGGADVPPLGDLGLELPEYDFLKGFEGVDDLKRKLEGILDDVLAIAGGLAAWKIASALNPDLSLLQGLLGALMVTAGITLVIDAIEDILISGDLTWDNILKGAAGGALIGGGLGSMLAKRWGLTWSQGLLHGALVGAGLVLMIESIISTIKQGLTWKSVLTGAAGGALAGLGLGKALAKKFGLTWKQSMLAGASIGLGVTLMVGGISSIIDEGVTLENALTTALGAIATGGGIGMAALKQFNFSPAKGFIIGASATLAISLAAVNFGGIASGAFDSSAFESKLMAALSTLAFGATGFALGGVGGLAIGVGVGLLVNVVSISMAEDMAQKQAAIDAFYASEMGQTLGEIKQNIESRSQVALDIEANIESLYGEIDNINLDKLAMAEQLLDDIFALDAIENKTKDEIGEIIGKVQTLNGLGLPGLTAEVDALTGQLNLTKTAADEVIDSLKKQYELQAVGERYMSALGDQIELGRLHTEAVKEQVTAYQAYRDALSETTEKQKAVEAAERELVEYTDEWARQTGAGPPQADQKFQELTETLGKAQSALEGSLTPLSEAKATYERLSEEVERYGQLYSDATDAVLFFEDELGRLGTTMQGTSDIIIDEAGNVISGYTDRLRAGLPEVGSAMQSVGEAAYTSLVDYNDSHSPSRLYEGEALNVIDGLANGLSDNIDIVTDAMTAVGNGMLDALDESIALGTSASLVMDRGETAMSDLNAGIKQETATIQSTMQDVGKMMMQGLGDGIRNNEHLVKNAMGTAIDNVIRKAKQDLEIHSPSRVMEREIGAQIMPGIAQGIEDTTGVAVESMSSALDELQATANSIETDPIDIEVVVDVAEFERQLSDLTKTRDRMTESLSGSVPLFSRGEMLSTDDIMGRITAIENYQTDLADLQARAIPQGILDEILSMSIESGAEFARQLNAMEDEAFEGYINAWTELQQKSQETANLIYGSQIAALEDSIAAMNVTYDASVNYQQLINEAVAAGDLASAALYEQQRNAKIAGEGLGEQWKQTFDFQGFSDSFAAEVATMGTGYTTFIESVQEQTTATKDAYMLSLDEAKVNTERNLSTTETMFKSMASRSNSAIQSIISNLNSIPRNITTTHTIVTQSVSNAKTSAVKAFASGGYPDHGQMFLARESGPELVGTIGSRTAVANNAQIEAGIEEAAYRGFLRAIAESQQEQQPIVVENYTYLDGKQIRNSMRQADRQAGAPIMAGGVMA